MTRKSANQPFTPGRYTVAPDAMWGGTLRSVVNPEVTAATEVHVMADSTDGDGDVMVYAEPNYSKFLGYVHRKYLTPHEEPAAEPAPFAFDPAEPESLSSAVYQALGAASMAWETTPIGVFDSTRAKEIGAALLKVITERMEARAPEPPTSEVKAPEVIVCKFGIEGCTLHPRSDVQR